MTAGPTFTDIVTAIAKSWRERKSEDSVFSLALPIKLVDPLSHLPLLSQDSQFSFLWDSSPGLCFGAAGRCQHFDLNGPRRFELAQRFTDAALARISDLSPEAPSYARSRILFAFTFFDQASERQRAKSSTPAVQAVLPRWQLARQGNSSWLRLNGLLTHEAEVRDFVEEIWLMRESLLQFSEQKESIKDNINREFLFTSNWENCYRPVLMQGIDLVNKGVLEKLVLAVRQSFSCKSPINPLAILYRLRHQQAGSCRFLWQSIDDQVLFGASPERLLSLRNGHLKIDALAGTATRDDDGEKLLRSEKDLREHELVVTSIKNQLLIQGLSPRLSARPKLTRHGKLVHLYTPIFASALGKLPLHLVAALHPTPAVAGFPRSEAMSWLRTLEPFERGGYAAPIGWIDNKGDAEFRVAIRSGNARGNELELTAGAGLVRGSIVERELQEVGLKLEVLADQLDSHYKVSTKRFIT